MDVRETIPSAERLVRRAKDLLKRLRAGDVSAAEILAQYHPGFAGVTHSDVGNRTIRLCDVQLAVARGSGFTHWSELLARARQRVPGSGRPTQPSSSRPPSAPRTRESGV